jgi:hypothetical protein
LAGLSQRVDTSSDCAPLWRQQACGGDIGAPSVFNAQQRIAENAAMAEAKTQPTTQSVASYVEAIDDEARRKDCKALATLMTRITGCAPTMWGTSIVGFDQYHYKYTSGHEGNSCIVGFSARKGPISIYMVPGFDAAQPLLDRLGKHKMGKACLYINKLADVKLPVLEQLLVHAVAETKQRYPTVTAQKERAP